MAGQDNRQIQSSLLMPRLRKDRLPLTTDGLLISIESFRHFAVAPVYLSNSSFSVNAPSLR